MGIRNFLSCRSKKLDTVPSDPNDVRVKLNGDGDGGGGGNGDGGGGGGGGGDGDGDGNNSIALADSPRSIIFKNNPLMDNVEKATTDIPSDANRRKTEKGGKDTEKGESTDYSLYTDDKGVPIYVTKQSYGYLSITISMIQTGILIAMMIECSIAPFSINPMIGPYPDALSYWGGKNAYYILYNEEWWRLFSSVLLHSGIFHLVCNVAIQLDSGAFFEKEWGSAVWLIVYVGSTVGASALSTVISPNTIGVGSSGSVCGIFGAKIAETICRCCEPRKTNYEKVRFGVLMKKFATTMCSILFILLFSFIPYVDWAAHVGGILSGFAWGIIIFSFKIKTSRWRILWLFFGIVFGGLFYSVVFVYMYQESQEDVAEEMSDVCSYYMKIFDNYECKCMLENYENDDDEN